MKRRNFLKAFILSPLAALIRPETAVAAHPLDWPGVPGSGIAAERRIEKQGELWEQWAPPAVTGDRHLICADDLPDDSIRLLHNRPCIVNILVDGKLHRIITQ